MKGWLKNSENLDGWRSVKQFFGDYWLSYGGKKQLKKSPYLHISFLLLPLTFGVWSQEGWWDNATSIVSSILGLTLGGFSILLALGSSDFTGKLAKAKKANEDPRIAPLSQLAATFVHFIVVQAIALSSALIASSFFSIEAPIWAEWLSSNWIVFPFWATCWFLTLYVLCLAVATAHYLYELILTYVICEKHKVQLLDDDEDSKIC